MYCTRELSEAEKLYVSRAQQKIAELTSLAAEEYARNDVDGYKIQLAIELQYSIEVLRSSELAWTPDEINSMMDYYTIKASLITFGFVSLTCMFPCGAAPGDDVWATVPQVEAVDEASRARDLDLQERLDQEILDRIAGDEALHDLIGLLGAGGALTIELISQINLGAIIVGQVFPIGTPLQDIWALALSSPAEVTDFTFDTFLDVREVGDNFTVAAFSWNSSGTLSNLVLSDSLGLINNQPVEEGSFIPPSPIEYATVDSGKIVWTLEADNMKPVEIDTDIWFTSYYGKEATADDEPVTVTEAKILAGEQILQDTTNDVTMIVNTTAGEQGFIAVAKDQSGDPYSRWTERMPNSSTIAVGDFIRPPVDTLVNGVTYSVYRWGYRSPITSTLTLHR